MQADQKASGEYHAHYGAKPGGLRNGQTPERDGRSRWKLLLGIGLAAAALLAGIAVILVKTGVL